LFGPCPPESTRHPPALPFRIDAYLDNNATTQPTPEVVAAVVDSLSNRWHNPSSTHRPGQAARAAVELARRDLAELLGVRARELVLPSGGTESIDLAFRGTLGAFRTRSRDAGPARLITSKVEHAAVRDVAADLEQSGAATVEYLPLDRQGRVDVETLRALLHDPSFGFTLVSVQWANNETGVVQPVEAVHATCAEHGAIFHCDAVQWVGRLPVTADPAPASGDAMPAHRHARTGLPPCDLLTFSAHKFHGPKGVGGLWIRQGVKVRPVLGGTQELGRRGGTENVPGIVGAGVAAVQAREWLEDAADRARLAAMRDAFERDVLEACPGSVVNGAGASRLWNTTNIAFPRLEAEAILMGLSELGLCASAGAACSSGSLDPSPVLLAMGVPEPLAHGSIRFSLSRFTTREELDQAVKAVVTVVGRLRATVQG
jgi:cysteine desulfurase